MAMPPAAEGVTPLRYAAEATLLSAATHYITLADNTVATHTLAASYIAGAEYIGHAEGQQ